MYAIILAVLSFACFIVSVYIQRRRSPNRPLFTCIFDALCAIPQHLKLLWWSEDSNIHVCLREAMKQTGLNDLGGSGNSRFIEKFERSRVLGMERSKAQVTPFGHVLLRSSLTRRMSTRLQFVDYLKKHPQISTIPIRRPIFVIGFPRTGTTFLHELLGLHPSVRMHYTWQQMDPVPTNKTTTDLSTLKKDLQDRKEMNRITFNTLLQLGGNAIQRVHRIGYEEPEECTVPCGMDLPWTVTEIPWIPFSAREVLPMGAGDAYTLYYKFLQLLTYQQEEVSKAISGLDWNWMLKCPFHLPYLTELFHAFPDATIVWTHRHPTECIASACSLYETLMGMGAYEDSIDREALGQAVLDYTEESLKLAEISLKKIGLGFDRHSSSANANTSGAETSRQSQIGGVRVVHVRYQDNVKSPKKVCRETFEQTGIECTDDYERLVEEYLRKNAESREKLKAQSTPAKGNRAVEKTLHEYSLADYGLSEEMVNERFSRYVDAFAL